MALLKCSDCGADVSDAAPTCPRCGRPSPAQAAALALQARVQEQRKSFAQGYEGRCLECGYAGWMGVARTRQAPLTTWPAIVAPLVALWAWLGAAGAVGALSMLGWFWSAVLGAGVVWVRRAGLRIFCLCPGCAKEIGPMGG